MYTHYGCFLLVWLGSVLAEVTVCLDRTRDVVVVWPEPVILFRTAGVSPKAEESCTETTSVQVEQLSSGCLHQSDPCASVRDFILHCDLTCYWKPMRALWTNFGEDNKLNQCRAVFRISCLFVCPTCWYRVLWSTIIYSRFEYLTHPSHY